MSSLMSCASAQGLGGLLKNVASDALSSVANKIIPLTEEDLEGTWMYAGPACEFGGDNFLKDASGMVLAAEVETKLTDIYTKAGITPTTFGYSFSAADKTFTTQYKKINLKGSFTLDSENKQLELVYQVLGLVSMGDTSAKIQKTGNKITLLFDAQKLAKLVSTLTSVGSTLTSSSILKTLDSVLSSYDNVMLGFDLTKQ